ncbi:DUF695 domain-containing protein [Paenisporosarcina sp. TG-14]|uniref:DUF695 domain-containing protein n=1 Tax=Paenisporosarcina sp. TG-14 TaxID=1231057 RepID=UPI0009D9655C
MFQKRKHDKYNFSQVINTEQYKHSFPVRFGLKSPNENGFHVGAEADELNEIEEAFKESAELKKYINIGRITTVGIRDIIFFRLRRKRKV